MRLAFTSGAALLAALALAGCASTPPAAPSIAAGAASIEDARAGGAGELAAADIDSARDKLERARTLARAGDQRGATRMAEQATVDAQLARSRSASERSRRAEGEVQASLQTLREELARSTAGRTQ